MEVLRGLLRRAGTRVEAAALRFRKLRDESVVSEQPRGPGAAGREDGAPARPCSPSDFLMGHTHTTM